LVIDYLGNSRRHVVILDVLHRKRVCAARQSVPTPEAPKSLLTEIATIRSKELWLFQ
jgi:hypothetical protein